MCIEKRRVCAYAAAAAGHGRAVFPPCFLPVLAFLLLFRASAFCDAFEADEIGGFFDTLVTEQLYRYRIPGAAVALVRNGETVFSAGYGKADLETGVSVNADTTVFRIASITKLFTWTALMQLVERGLVDPDEDVNRYLKTVRVPAAFPRPVTPRSLMTHTSGFEDVGIGTMSPADRDHDGLSAYLKNHLPSRVKPVGTEAMYSNHGAALAGLIVSEVSGMSYEEYVERELFAPLGMKRTTVRQPVPEPLRGDLAKGYRYIGDRYISTDFTVDLLTPSGGGSSTARDMAVFMTAHLEGGVFANARILEKETVERMHETAFTMVPGLPGWAYGFQEMRLNGRRVLFHDGSFQNCLSLLVLFPSERTGLFIVYNGSGGGAALNELLNVFADRFFPDDPSAAEDGAPGDGDAGLQAEKEGIASPVPKGISGSYIQARRPYTTIEKLTRPVPVVSAIVDASGTVSFLGRAWKPGRNGLYRDPDGELMGVITDGSGRAEGLAVGAFAFDRLPWYEHPYLHIACGVAAFCILVSCPLVLFAGMTGRRRGRTAVPALVRTAQVSAGGASLLLLVSVIAILAVIASVPLRFGAPPVLTALSLLPVAGAVCGCAAVLSTAVLWIRRTGGIAGRIYLTAVAAAICVVVFLSYEYGMLGPHFG